MDENTVEIIGSKSQRIFEVIGIPNENLFVDIKQCHGKVNINFYESDYDNINNKQKSDHKTITENNALIHYV